jgi:iron complex outermembrane receptor protein
MHSTEETAMRPKDAPASAPYPSAPYPSALRPVLLRSCALLLLAGVAHAQTVPAPAKTEEVIVTGQRKSQTLQKAPVSVTVLGRATLAAAGVKRAQDFVALTPGVSLVAGTAEVGDSQINIRGINSARDAESAFAFVLDGVLMPNPAAFNREFADLSQIEVLKGPQGAIYGRNAEAGAIVVTTTPPGNAYDASVKTGVGQYGDFYNLSTLAGPIVKDQLFGRLSVDYRDFHGFDTNVFLHNKSVDNDTAADFDGRLVYTPSEDWKFDFKARVGRVSAASIDYNAVFELPGFTSVFGPTVNENVNAHQFEYVSNIQPEDHQGSAEFSLKADHDLGWGKLTAYVLYSNITNNLLSDGTLATFGFFDNANNVTGRNVCQASQAAALAGGLKYPAPQNPAFGFLGPYTASTCDGYQYQVRNEADVSTEIRISSNADQRWRWSAGGYYLHIDRHVGVSVGDDTGSPINQNLDNAIGSTSPTAQLFDDKFTTNVFAGFASTDYSIMPDLIASAAIRYDVEVRDDQNLVPAGNRQDFINVVTGGAANGTFFPLNPGLIANPNGIPSASKTFQAPEPRVSLSWTPIPQATLYATFGVGFKSGGFNPAGAQATVANVAAETGSNVRIGDTYGEETSDAYEVGMKGAVLDRRLAYQLAAYYTQVHGMQFNEFFSTAQGLLRVDSNIDRVDLQGGEAAVQARALDWLDVVGGVDVTGSEILKNASRPDTVGNKSPYTPAYTGNVGFSVHQKVTDAYTLIGRWDTNLVGPTWFHTVQRQSEPTIFGAPGYYGGAERQAFSTSNLRAGVAGPHFELVGFIQNIFDKRYLAEVIPAPEFGGSFASQGPGRLIGAELTLHL